MKLVCVNSAQIRVNKRILTLHPGEVVEYDGDEVPANFEIVGKREPDFAKDSASLLVASDWKPSDAAKAVKELYGVELKTKGKARDDIINQVIDARNRAVDITPAPKVTVRPKVAAKPKVGKK